MRTISPGFIGGGRKRGWLPTSQTDIWGALGGGILSFPHKIVKMDQIFFSFFHTVKFDESVEMKTTRPRVEIQIFLNSCRWIVRMVGGGWVGILFSRWFYFTNFELLNRLTAVWKRNILQPPPPSFEWLNGSMLEMGCKILNFHDSPTARMETKQIDWMRYENAKFFWNFQRWITDVPDEELGALGAAREGANFFAIESNGGHRVDVLIEL